MSKSNGHEKENHELKKKKKTKPKKLSAKAYEKELTRLEIQLVALQAWIKTQGLKIVVIFEGRDTAGKGGTIKRITQRLSPRVCRVVALGTPTEKEKSQWYFQRYVPHLPSAGEMVLFDRSWYNRAGVEKVMEFCTPDQYEAFMATVNGFEQALVQSGTLVIKYWLDIDDDTQEKRFQARIHDQRKGWKLSPMDLFARSRWVEFSKARDVMLARTNSGHSPWYIVDANDKKCARLNIISHLLSMVPFEDLPAEEVELPPRQESDNYHHPDMSGYNHVPKRFP